MHHDCHHTHFSLFLKQADALDEVVGLDVSYHGGVILKDSDVQPEYISAFNARRDKRRSQRSNASGEPSDDMFKPGAELSNLDTSRHYNAAAIDIGVEDDTEQMVDDSVDASARRDSGHVSVRA